MNGLLIATLSALVAIGHCGNYTVTEEVWFEVEIRDLDGPGDDYRGRIVVAVFGESCPMTSMNFATIAKGFKIGNEKLHYKNTKIHRIVPDFLVQMGDITVGDGTGTRSIFGDKFVDENFIISHRAYGIVSMANHGKDTNGSQFFILLNKARWLDGKHVAFGKVIKGMDVLKTLGEVPTDTNNAVPKRPVRILDSGINDIKERYELTEAEVDSEEDL